MNNKERIEISDEMVREFLDHFVHDKGKVYSEWEAFLESKKPKPLFTTLDGKDIMPWDDYYFIGGDWSVRFTGRNFNWVGSGLRAFSDEKSANEYVYDNKPCLSYNDICGLWTLGPDERQQLSELVNKKIQ